MTPDGRRFFGLSLGHTTEDEAERWLRSFGVPVGAEARVHKLERPYPHVAISLAVPAGTRLTLPPVPPRLAPAAARAATVHATGRTAQPGHSPR